MNNSNKDAAEIDTTTLVEPSSPHVSDDIEDDMAVYYLVVADTGYDYFSLRNKMFSLSNQLSLVIDTMGRYYDAEKKQIILPPDAEDEIFAGDYLPRRFPDSSLSIEYMSYYSHQTTDETFALVAGIYETENAAVDAAFKIKEHESKVFVIPAEIYIGCIH